MPGDETPECPRCDNGTVTFEGKAELPLSTHIWNRVSPFFNYLFRPWIFFQGREIPRSVGIFLIMVLYVGMFTACYQANLSDQSSESIGAPGTYYVMRDPGVLVDELTQVTSNSSPEVPRPSQEKSEAQGPPLGQIGMVYVLGLTLELYWAGILLVVMGWDKFRDVKAQLGAVMAGSVWMPNLLLAMAQILYFRSLQYGYFESLTEVTSAFYGGHLILASGLTYVFVGGLFSIDIRFSQYVTRLLVTVFLQLFGIFMILYLTKLFIFPSMGLPAGGTGPGILKEALRLFVWPFAGMVG